MIFSLLYQLIKAYDTKNGILMAIQNYFKKYIIFDFKKIAVFIPHILLAATTIMGQEKNMYYNIFHNEDKIGVMIFNQRIAGNLLYLKISSDVETRFLIKINIQSTEEAVFDNGILLTSSICRYVNGKEKINKQTKRCGKQYQLISNHEQTGSNGDLIVDNILTLYYREPLNISKIYSDSFQQFLDLKKEAAHCYKIALPDGNENLYFFQDGICTKIDVYHSFYHFKILLSPQK